MNYRNKANITLAVVFTGFLFSAVLLHLHKEVFALRLVYFVLEAALVGGIADWFAVTALFKKPLGFAYHTALIPRNREKVVEAVAQMVEKDLLGVKAIKSKLKQAGFVAPVINWVDNHNGVEYAARAGTEYLQHLIAQLDLAITAERLERLIKDWLMEQDLSKLIRDWAQDALADRPGTGWPIYLLDKAISLARDPGLREKIHNLLKEQEEKQTRGNWLKGLLANLLTATNSLNLADAAAALQGELVKQLEALKNPADPLRLKLREILQAQLAELSPEYQATVESWKQEALQDIPLQDMLQQACRSIVAQLVSRERSLGAETGSPAQDHSVLARWVLAQASSFWHRFKQDIELQDWLDRYIRLIAGRIVQAEHHLTGQMVRETLSALSDADLNAFVDARAGNDLQWIRINGSIIGGAVGLLLFLLLNFVYDPLVIPLLHRTWGVF